MYERDRRTLHDGALDVLASCAKNTRSTPADRR